MARREWNVAGNGQVERLAKSAGTPNNTREPAQTDKKKPQLITVGASVLVEAGEVKPRSASEGVSPCRIDVVSCALETRHGLWFAQMPIKPKGVSKKKRTFGAPVFQYFTGARGRFVDLLPVKDAGETGAGTLH